MKKLVLTIALAVSSVSFAQTPTGITTYKHTVGLGYTTMGSIDVNFVTENDQLIEVFDKFGLGMTVGLKYVGSGEDYTNNDYTYGFNDQQNLGTDGVVNNFGMYGLLGKQWGFFSLCGKLGFGTTQEATNFYDPSHIFGDNGYYYKITKAETKIIAGAVLGVDFTDRINLNMGIDTYNEITFGVGIKF